MVACLRPMSIGYTKHYYAGTDYADSGSLQHDIAIQLSVIPRKGGTLMPANMENVCWLSDFSKKFQIYFDISRKSCIFAPSNF